MKRAPAVLHPIQVVARRTGLSPDVIRVWERRYGAVRPVRSGANRRLYGEAELERLQLLARATRSGRHIGQIATLDTPHLREVVESDARAEGTSTPPAIGRPTATGAAGASARRLLADALSAVCAMDGAALERALGRAAVALPRSTLLEGVVAPLLQRIGDLWREGDLRVAHEHLASAVVRNCLAQLMRTAGAGGGPVLVAGTPAGQLHEFGALLAALEAEAAGFEIAYLGPNLPVEEIAAAAAALRARAVALSLVYPSDDPRLGPDLGRLRRQLGPEVVLLAGGGAASAYADVLTAAGGEVISSLRDLRARLHTLRGG